MISLVSLQDGSGQAASQIISLSRTIKSSVQHIFVFGLLISQSLSEIQASGSISSGNTKPYNIPEMANVLPSASVADPVLTVRCANPQFNCTTDIYCLDVEFQSDLANKELFGMNVRFLYDDGILEFHNISGFLGGYGAIAPNPPTINPITNGAPWNFSAGADYVNGAIQKVNANAPPIYISTTGWTKLFQVCFTIDLAENENSFCPPVVWDLEQNPANGGYPPGSAGVVMTVVNGSGSSNAVEAVDHFNWQYVGSGGQPYGEPIEEVCSSVDCGTCSLIVTSNADSGANSLREIINCANSGDTITFGSSMAGATITISTTKLIINKTLYIRSSLSPRVKITSTIPGLIEIGTGKTVEFKSLEITSGVTVSDNSGAAFKNQGILRLIDVRVYKNAALGTGQYLIKNFPSSQCHLFGSNFIEIP
jgi:hypothetical protein